MAAPFGPPPSVAITRTLPSGVTRERVCRSISTRTTEPSGIATGPSGNRKPDAICVIFGSSIGIVSSSVAAILPGCAGSIAGELTGCDRSSTMRLVGRGHAPSREVRIMPSNVARADVVGSLLRPAYLRDARKAAHEGTLD